MTGEHLLTRPVFFVYSHGQGESVHRGRAPLFSDTQQVYQGYRTHKPGSFSWPFSFDLPTHPDISAIAASKHQWPEREHFLSTEDYIPGHPMPPTFRMWKFGFGFRWHAFVEYVLRVEVKEADGASMILPSSSRRAVKPIVVKHLHGSAGQSASLPMGVHFTIPEQLDDKLELRPTLSKQANLQTQVSRLTVRTSKLHNWNQNRSSSLSFSDSLKDKARSVLNSSSLPAFTFDIRVAVPEQFSLLEEGAIPISVAAVALAQPELTTIPVETYPDVRIDNLTLDIIASTYIRFKSIFPSHAKTKHEIRLLDRAPVNHTIDMKQHYQVTAGMKDKASGNTHQDEIIDDRAFDLSTLPGLNPALKAAKLGKQHEKPLMPTFHSYIIAREYTIIWRMELDVAGERLKVSSGEKIRVRVMPPKEGSMNAFMLDTGPSREDTGNGRVEGESDVESDEVTSDTRGGKLKLLRKSKSRSKQQEAEEEAAAAESSSAPEALQARHGERDALPSYEQHPREFAFRNGIDAPPSYEARECP